MSSEDISENIGEFQHLKYTMLVSFTIFFLLKSFIEGVLQKCVNFIVIKLVLECHEYRYTFVIQKFRWLYTTFVVILISHLIDKQVNSLIVYRKVESFTDI